MSKCKWCNIKFEVNDKPKGWMANHSRWCSQNPNLTKYKEKLADSRKSINYETVSTSIKQAWKDGKYDNMNFSKTRKPLSDSHKLKISNALRSAHLNGRHSGWTHVNTNISQMSRPEKTFQKMLQESKVYDKYHIEYGYAISKYFLDFAILNLKIDIEIDGVQHIRNISNIEHDNKRDRFLLDSGWRVYRISIKELLENTVIQDLLSFIESDEKYRKYDSIEILKKYK
jgi:very-short-patch-repair endonuclease